MRNTRRHLVLSIYLSVVVIFGWFNSGYSTQTEIWTTNSFEEFRGGESDNVSLTTEGALLLAPQSEQLLTLEDQDLFVWALAGDSKGNIYAGTGDQGKIFKIAPTGEVSLFFDSPEIGIMSLAVDSHDNVYAGSAPDGLIYKITPEGGQTTFFSTGEHYVWALAFDANNILYAGTGENGKIFKLLPDGTGTGLYDSPQSHIMSLLYDPQGWLYAGAEGKGITYKIALDDGRVFSLYNAEEEEIHALALDQQGNLYINAITNKFYPKPQEAAAPAGQQPPPKGERLKKSVIYQISPQGTVTKLLEFAETLIYAMVVDANDHLLVGTDEKGMLYRIFPDKQYHQVFTVKTGTILALFKDAAAHIYMGTGDAGGVYRLAPRLVDQGSYLSIVHDVRTTATWGKVFWRGTPNQISLLTRTGNTAVPSDTWSPWSDELRNQDGETISSPPARFIQWKAMLLSQGQQPPMLEEVSVSYLSHNLPPEITQIVIYYPMQLEQQAGQNSQETSTTPPASRKNSSKIQDPAPKPPKFIPPGYVAIVWQAADPNQEKLFYTISLRGAQEKNWKVLEEELEEPVYMLDTGMIPDGEYYIKISATDLPDNPPDKALTVEKMSERFEIDNTAPEVSIALNQKQDNNIVFVTVIAQDDWSRLQKAEYALDAGEWTPIFPEDEVTDSREEKYSISLSKLTPEEHILVFRVMDRNNNIGVAKLVFSPQSAPSTEEEPPTAPKEEQPGTPK